MAKSKKVKGLPIDKNSIQYLKYRDIAIDFIKSGYTNIRGVYSKYYPLASDDSLDAEPYRLLDNVRFQSVLQEIWQEVKIEDLDIAHEVIICLRKEMLTAKNPADRINAASWLGKSEAIFTDKSEVKALITLKPEQEAEYNRLRGKVNNNLALAKIPLTQLPQGQEVTN